MTTIFYYNHNNDLFFVFTRKLIFTHSYHKSLIFIKPLNFYYSANANIGYGQGNGVGFDGGINTPFGGVNADFGLQAPRLANNNLLMGLIVFLGVMSFINILATVVTPWIAGLGGDSDDGDDAAEKNVEKGRRYQRNINMMADYVLNGIESFAKKHE